MKTVQELNEKIGKLLMKVAKIQEACDHPKETLDKVARANTGNYDPSSDHYWWDLHCHKCNKTWMEDQ